ncbi:MAG: MltA domain-containing protein [Algisphaera sp.]
MLQRFLPFVLLILIVVPGCRSTQRPDYARPLGPGARALRPVPEAWRAELFAQAAQQLGKPELVTALGRSVDWFRIASTKDFFPVAGMTHTRAQASVETLLELAEIADVATRESRLHAEFSAYESVGYNGQGVVFFTGYFSPEFTASRERGGAFQFPLYARPTDLQTDAATGTVLGQLDAATGTVQPYPPRAHIESSGMLEGQELVWLPSRLDAYSIEVNGSAKLQLDDGNTMFVGYAGTNGREYTSIGRLLVSNGALDKNTVSMPTIRTHFQKNPQELDYYIQQNERFVFFREYEGNEWPAGSLGFRVTPERSLATDKKIFPRGGLVLASTQLPGGESFRQLMLDQDTGGAIRAPGRADLYFGIGPAAEQMAGQQAAEGRLFYFFLTPND